MSRKNDMDLIIGMGDDEGLGSFSKGGLAGAGLQSLKRTVAFLSIAFALVIIVLSFLGHRILSARLGDIHSAGEKESQTLSQNFEAGLTDLAARQDALEKRVESDQKASKARDKKTKSALSLLNQGLYKARSLYAPKKEFQDLREKTQTEIAALGKGLKDAVLKMREAAGQMDERAGRMAGELADGLESASRRLKDMSDELALAQADISSLAADKANKKDLREEISKAAQALRGALEENQGRMDSLKGKVDSLNGQVDALKSQVDSSLKGRISALKGRLDSLKDRMGRMEETAAQVETLGKEIDKIAFIQKRFTTIEKKMGRVKIQMDSIRNDISKIDDIQSDLYFQKQETNQIKKMLSPPPGNDGDAKSREDIIETEITGGE
ncbi:hypothetical protein EPICR_50186 [Candidatus Desulfarcum epimagneticum]|uniref:Uncharacterized protein n=1 Tax=uncultured Desulfobacteraceae bacterium TaxID=218296 RepID=A0A484HPX0_9BACT|nr:hypothetical protein EPICR_50186 [uncultured Desulfobacteraceae bacterium]